MSDLSPRKFSLFGVNVNNVTMEEAVDNVMSFRGKSYPQTVCFVNVNTLNLAREHQDLNVAVNDADWVFPDGSGVRIAASRMGINLKDNVNGTDMLPLICERAVKEGVGMFLLGAEPGVADQAAENLKTQYPGIKIAGSYHGYFDKEHSDSVIFKINRSGANLLFVALGSPVQERWLKENRHLLSVDTVLAVGGLFDFYSGRIPRAPKWLRSHGLEWVWRLIQEPRKKFHRYVVGNPVFLWRCFRQLERV